MDYIELFVRGAGSMALISIHLRVFGESRKQQRLRCITGYRLPELEARPISKVG